MARIVPEKKPILMLTFPLGILLNQGVTLQIDSGKTQKHMFELCTAEGCHIGIPLNKSLLGKMKKGSTAKIKIYDAQLNPIKLPLSLKGFTMGYSTLKAKSK